MVMSHINLGSSLVFPSCSIEYQLTVPMLVPQSVYMLMFLAIQKKLPSLKTMVYFLSFIAYINTNKCIKNF